MGIPRRATLGLLALVATAGLALVFLRGTGPADRRAVEEPGGRAPGARPPEDPHPSAPLAAPARAPEGPSTPRVEPALASGGVTTAAPDPAPDTPLPLSHLAGALADPQGRWIGDLPLHWRTGREVVRSTTSDVFGAFQLTDLPCVPGELVLGNPASPVVPARPLELRPGVVDLGTIEVPLLGELELRVLDEQGRPVADVGLTGTGDRGGAIAVRSGPDGVARARLLPRGMYRVFGSHPELGRGNTVFEYAPDATEAIEVRLRRSAPPE